MRRAAILIGPEYGTVSRPDLTAAAREANEAGFDMLIACAFNFDAHASELDRLGPLPILKARMNPDLHMSDELKNTGKGNLFVIFGEPDIDIETLDAGEMRVTVNGVDVFDPKPATSVPTMCATSPPGSSTPTTTKKASLSATPISSAPTTPTRHSRPRCRPRSTRMPGQPFTARHPPLPAAARRRIAVKVINHFGDEVMKVYRV